MKLKSPIPLFTRKQCLLLVEPKTSPEQTLIPGEAMEEKLERGGMRRIFYFPGEIASQRMHAHRGVVHKAK